MPNYYGVLGISENSSDKEIRQAYRQLARKYHPDLHPGDGEANEQFKKINEAYEVLSDQSKREKYDTYGDQWKHTDHVGSRFGADAHTSSNWTFRHGKSRDIFGSNLFGGLEDVLHNFGVNSRSHERSTASPRMQSKVSMTLREAFAGTKRLVTISGPYGERQIEVSIPAGVDTGSLVCINLDGSQDLFINVSVSPNPEFKRKGADLYKEIEIPLSDAILGGEIAIDTLKGKVRMKVPAESQNGQRIRLSGQGMPALGQPATKGDLFVTLRPKLPKGLSEEERNLVRQLGEILQQKRQ